MFFFKQKTAYDMRISDWSSDVCSSDLNTDFVTTSSAPSGTSHIRSFVHRRAHITPGQKEALDRLLPLWSLPYRNGLLEFDKVFGRQAPTVLEIGFGMGENTQKIAQARPGDNFMAIEVINAGGGALLKRLKESGPRTITNNKP